MMFRKKKVEAPETFEDRRYKELTLSMNNLVKEMRKNIRAIELCQNCANMLPNGADKDDELARAEEGRKRLRNLISAYDEDYRAWKAIDKTHLVRYREWTEPKDSHDALHFAYRTKEH